LWCAAADGLGDGAIWPALEKAQEDLGISVVTLAGWALADLAE